MSTAADPFTQACPLFRRANALGGRTGQAWESLYKPSLWDLLFGPKRRK